MVTVSQLSLSEDAFVYWEQIQRNNSQSGSLFDPVPGNIPTNFENINDPNEDALGFFYVTQTDTLRRLIRPAEVNRPRRFCIAFPEGEGCMNCLIRDNSTDVKPDYWID